MFDSKNSTYAVEEINDDLIAHNNITLENFSLDLSSLFKFRSFQGNESLSQEETNYLQNQFDFNSIIKNSQSFYLEDSFSSIGNELPDSENYTNQELFPDNLNPSLSSESTFAATYDSRTYAYDASIETAQAVYLGHFQGTLGADKFTYTLDAGEELAVISGNGNINYGSGYYDSINFSDISVNQVTDYSFAEIGSGGELFNTGNGDHVFDYITLDNGSKILFEGIDKIVFSDGEIDLTVNPNDTGYLDQWNLHMMGVQNAWRFTTGSDKVLVGVQDSGLGVDSNGNFHPDLNNTLYYSDNVADELYREVPDDSYQRSSSHGTSVQGIIGAATDNGVGIAGINWDSYVFNIDLDIDENAGDLDIVDATQRMINYANSEGQRLVINMSISYSYSSAFEQLVANNQDNALFVIATGNNGRNGISHPSSLAKYYDNVIAVGASWGFESEYTGFSVEAGTRADYSNYGEGITLMGPTAVLSTGAFRDSGFGYNYSFNGTSAATPNVTGVASLVWSANSNLSATQVKSILSETAYDLGDEGYDLVYGHGFVNADAAVRRAIALSYSDSLTGASIDNSFSTANTSGYEESSNEFDPLTGNNYSNQFALEEDSLLLTQQILDYSELELIDNTTINLGATNTEEMMGASLDSFPEGSDYNFAPSNGLGEDNIFYNTVEI